MTYIEAVSDEKLDRLLGEEMADYCRSGCVSPWTYPLIKEYIRRHRTSKGRDKRGNI